MAALPSIAQPNLRRQRGSEPKDPSGASWQAMPISDDPISAKLIGKWSPQQIAGWLMREHPDEEDKRVSHETI